MTTVTTIGVLGAGERGAGIAERIAVAGYPAILVDTKPDILERAMEAIKAHLEELSLRPEPRFPESVEDILSRIHATCDSTELSKATVVIECLPEERDIKRDDLKRLSHICPSETVFATSYSSGEISDISKGLPCRDRLVGMHFFANPAENRLIEIIGGAAEKPSQILEQVSLMIGGIVIRSADTPGFVVKRQTAAIFSEAVRILNEGDINIPTIDAGARDAFGAARGPFEEMNAMGIEVAERFAYGLVGHLPSLYLPPERLRAQAASHEPWAFAGEIDEKKRAEVRDRFSGVAVLVGATIADEGVASSEAVNLGVKYGLGYSQGPFDIINRLGNQRAGELASKIATEHALPVPNNLVAFEKKGFEEWTLSRVDVEIRDKVAVISLCHPETMNELDELSVSQLESAFKSVERNDSVEIIVFTGMGGHLANGPSPEVLAERLAAGDTESILGFYKRIHALFSRIAASPKTTIAWARGMTMGGGFELGLACRYLVASSRAFFLFPETGRGIHPGLGATQRLPRKVGKSIGKYVIMTGEVLTAQSAERLGIVDVIIDDVDHIGLLFNNLGDGESLSDDDIVPSDDELTSISLFNPENCRETLLGNIKGDSEAAQKVKRALSRKAPAALTIVNKLIDDGLGLEISRAMAFELSALGLILGTKDALLGLKAHNWEPPTFTGE